MILCQLCYKEFKIISFTHLRKHNITYQEYRKLFPIFEGNKRSEETKEKISLSRMDKIPWNKGLNGCQVAWNKGLKGIYSSETLDKMSKSRVGKSSYFKGKHHTEETKKQISKNHADCSGPNNGMYGITGEQHHCWKGGISFLPYCPKFDKNKREEIRELYYRKCFICNKDEKDNIAKSGKQRKLSVHHLDLDKEQGCNGKKFKLVPLCLNCHNKVHHDEELMNLIITKLEGE